MQLGERQFTEGTTRPVYRDDDGRQYVLDDEGEPVYSVWLHPDEYARADDHGSRESTLRVKDCPHEAPEA
ncbi:MAG TPA: hypothetical protein VGP68_15960 [Gemmataceae bacterium]|nr:hypothetical protein [Gemmataceae bacterium]